MMATDAQSIIDSAAPATEIAPAADVAPVDHQETLYPDDQREPANDQESQTEALEGEEAQTELEPIAAPASWSKEDKAHFEGLPREAQEIVSRRERERDLFLQTKSREAAETRQTVEIEARRVIQQVHQAHAEKIQQYAQMFEPQPPDIRLLQTGDPQHQALYNEQDRQYRIDTAQHQRMQQEMQQARQQAEALEQQALQAQTAQELSLLAERIPEWSDPSARPKLLESLQSIGQELGYSSEQMSQARASDILALNQALAWKADAEKWRAAQKAKMIPVRAAKQIAPVARAGAAGQGRPPVQNIAATLYPNDVRR